MAKIIDHFVVVVRHTDGTCEAGKSNYKPSHQDHLYSIWQGDGDITEKVITLANVVSVAVTPVFEQ